MNVTLLKVVVTSVPACMLFSGSVGLFIREKSVSSVLQLLGAGCYMLRRRRALASACGHMMKEGT
jgi:hypothetical protein